MDIMKDDVQAADVTEEDAGQRVRWRQVICCGDPLKGAAERR